MYNKSLHWIFVPLRSTKTSEFSVSGTEQKEEENMRIAILFLMIVAFVSGCATSKKTYTSDGREGYSINCSGSALNWGMCYEKAGELCGSKGYEVLEKSGDTGAMVTAGQYGLFGGSVINRSMIIK